MIDLETYLKETNTVLLTKDAFEYLKKRASAIEKIKEVVIKWQTDTWTDNLSHECICEIADIVAESEDKKNLEMTNGEKFKEVFGFTPANIYEMYMCPLEIDNCNEDCEESGCPFNTHWWDKEYKSCFKIKEGNNEQRR